MQKLIEGEAGRFTLMVDYIMENSVIGVRKDGSELRVIYRMEKKTPPFAFRIVKKVSRREKFNFLLV